MTTTSLAPSALVLLSRSRLSLASGSAVTDCGERYLAAHLSALRAAAAVCAVRGRPATRGGPRSIWEVLPRIAPEMAEWAAVFAGSAARRARIEAGRAEVITPREADDLLRNAEAFFHAVEAFLGLPSQPTLPTEGGDDR